MTNEATDITGYTSPFSRRYASKEMRELFNDRARYRLWRKVWVALAEVENQAGLVTNDELADLKKHQKTIDIERIETIELDTHHDVVSALREFAEKAQVGGSKLHLGATSVDITDNAEAIRTKDALILIDIGLG